MRIVCFGALLLSLGCGLADSAGQSDGSGDACLGDTIGELRLSPRLPDCESTDWWCRAACFVGDAASCLGRAYSLEQESATAHEAARLFHRACLLGLANACTNFAAIIWARDHNDDELLCALRTFGKACAAKEPFACGMVGRVLLESASSASERSEAHQGLEVACQELRGYPCRVLAKHLESGELGSYDPERIAALLKRACEGGDSDACGAPPTASETFH